MIEKIVQIIDNQNALEGAQLTLSRYIIVDKKSKKVSVLEADHKGHVFGSLCSETSMQKLKQVRKALQRQHFYQNLQIKFKLGTLFHDYANLQNLLTGQMTKLAHKPGEVLLVDIWAAFFEPRQPLMAQHYSMLVKNKQQWKDKVKIVGISLDQDREATKKYVLQQKWENITHLSLSGVQETHHLIRDLHIERLPFVCLVNKFGKIVYIGYPEIGFIERQINLLINQEAEVPQKATQTFTIIPEKAASLQELKQFTSVLTKEKLTEDIKDIDFLFFTAEINEYYRSGTMQGFIEIKAALIEGDKVNLAKAELYFKKFKISKLTFQTVKYTNIPFEQKPVCWQCKKDLIFPYYWLMWEASPTFGCRSCVQSKSKEAGQHYTYCKNSILLTSKWPTFRQKPSTDTFTQIPPHSYICNICKSSSFEVGQPRMICMGCRTPPNYYGDYIDLCQNCLEKAIRRSQGIEEALVEEEHDWRHPWLRVLYNCGGYNDF